MSACRIKQPCSQSRHFGSTILSRVDRIDGAAPQTLLCQQVNVPALNLATMTIQCNCDPHHACKSRNRVVAAAWHCWVTNEIALHLMHTGHHTAVCIVTFIPLSLVAGR
jgi:hypothetical protein